MCDVKVNRNCIHCRYNRCLEIGMNPNNTQEARKTKIKRRAGEPVTGPSTAYDNEEDNLEDDDNDEDINVVEIDEDADEDPNATAVITRPANEDDGQNWINKFWWLMFQLNNPRKKEVEICYTIEEDIWVESLRNDHGSVAALIVPHNLQEVLCYLSDPSDKKCIFLVAVMVTQHQNFMWDLHLNEELRQLFLDPPTSVISSFTSPRSRQKFL